MLAQKLRTCAGAFVSGLVIVACAQLADIGAGVDAPALEGPPPTSEQRTDANIEIAPVVLDFADVRCGTEAPAKLITIHNKGDAPAPYRVELPEGTSFRLDGPPDGTVGAKGTVSLHLFVKPQTARENAADLFVTAGDAVQPIHVRANGLGATFELPQSTIDFGEVRKENGAPPVEVEVQNNGTEAATTTLDVDNAAFDVKWTGKPAALVVEPGMSAKFTVGLNIASSPDSAKLKATVVPTSNKAFCGTPMSLAVSGQRVTSELTVSSADWGQQWCNAPLVDKDVVITNYANAIVGYTASLPAGSRFSITDAGPGSVAAAASPTSPTTATLKVRAPVAGAPLTDLSELLAVNLTSTGPGFQGLKQASLHVDVRGAILTITPPELKTFVSNGYTTDTKTFAVANSGRDGIALDWVFVRTVGGPAWTYSPPAYVAAGAQKNGSVGFTPSSRGDNQATLTAQRAPNQTPATVICNTIQPIALEGTKP